jgi:hypothetical protein
MRAYTVNKTTKEKKMKINVCVTNKEISYNIPKNAYELNIKLLVEDEYSGLNGFIEGKLSLENDEHLFYKNSYGSQCVRPTKDWIQQNKIFQRQVETLGDSFQDELNQKQEIKVLYQRLKKHKKDA